MSAPPLYHTGPTRAPIGSPCLLVCTHCDPIDSSHAPTPREDRPQHSAGAPSAATRRAVRARAWLLIGTLSAWLLIGGPSHVALGGLGEA
jgi:hypothetical protein